MKNIYQNDSCSTFLIKRSNKQYIGHNLDERTPNPVNGAVFINRRGENKIGISKSNLQEGFDDLSKHFTWVSRYGSITFNVYGKDMIDGGFNEKGLYIQEMTLIDGIPPTSKDDRLPTLTFEMWMQYVLDNYSEVQEVIDQIGVEDIVKKYEEKIQAKVWEGEPLGSLRTEEEIRNHFGMGPEDKAFMIIIDGRVSIFQPFVPGVPGKVPLTEDNLESEMNKMREDLIRRNALTEVMNLIIEKIRGMKFGEGTED